MNYQTCPVKYLFLDVVGFTHNRSVESQSDIVSYLNTIVLDSIKKCDIPIEKCIFLPTGDGICIALLNVEDPFDIHIQLAISIVASIHEHNEKTQDAMRRFEVRIGINSNTDNLVTDINLRQNLAGAGINIAARVMSKADANQILVSDSVHETLRYREQYMEAFKRYDSIVKHQQPLRVYQLIQDGHIGLNTVEPAEFQKPESKQQPLSVFEAFHLAHVFKNQDFIYQRVGHGQNNYSLTVLFYFLASDSVRETKATQMDPASRWIYKEGALSLPEVFDYYQSVTFAVICQFAHFCLSEINAWSCYEREGSGTTFPLAISSEGKRRLREEWPAIWQDFELE
jgi:class 3 adenylate cyclase